MDKVRNKLTSNSGESYIYLCVIVVFISMLLSVVILYMSLTVQVQMQKRDVKNKLDSYVSEYSTQVFDAIKQGENYADHINWTDFEKQALVSLGFDHDAVTVYDYPNGTAMTRPVVTVLKGNGFGIAVYYQAVLPVTWNGQTYSQLVVPITVSSYYKFK